MTRRDYHNINSIEKYELCKRKVLSLFLMEFKRSDNPRQAYEKAKAKLVDYARAIRLRNFRQMTGLRGELLYFYKNRSKYSKQLKELVKEKLFLGEGILARAQY